MRILKVLGMAFCVSALLCMALGIVWVVVKYSTLYLGLGWGYLASVFTIFFILLTFLGLIDESGKDENE